MISIFVAGTVELSGSKSPIVAMAEVCFGVFFFKSLLNPLSSHLYYCTNFPVAIISLFHPPEDE